MMRLRRVIFTLLALPFFFLAGNLMNAGHPIHLGVVVVMTLAMGLVTPPYGLCLLLACGIAGVPVLRVMPIMVILIGSIVVVVLLAALFPGIVLTVPRLLVPGWM